MLYIALMAAQAFEIPDDAPRGATVMLGNFDGVHRGHCSLVARARALGAPVVALTFEPHPRSVLHPQASPYRLTDAEEKRSALIAAGVDAVLTLRFDFDMAAMSAEAFVSDVLVRRLGAGSVVVGRDYRFGRSRAGDLGLLQRLGETHGFSVVAIAPVTDGLGARYSSSLIRALLAEGQVEKAADLLGRAWSISVNAQLENGGHLAATLDRYIRLPAGRYAVRTQRAVQPEKHAIAVLERRTDRLVLAGDTQPGWLTIAFDSRLEDEASLRQLVACGEAGYA